VAAARHAVLAVLSGAILLRCGPSVSTIYEGNIRFEHCYRLDLDHHIAPTHRAECWREWADRYTYGQTRDRLEYARRRMSALNSGDTTRPELRLDLPDGATPDSSPEVPVPTSVHASPPPLLVSPKPDAEAPAAASDASAPDAGPQPPGAECIADCRQTWKDCDDSCATDAAPKSRACKSCSTDYGRCVQRCLK
jgi:hypothetical protein